MVEKKIPTDEMIEILRSIILFQKEGGKLAHLPTDTLEAIANRMDQLQKLEADLNESLRLVNERNKDLEYEKKYLQNLLKDSFAGYLLNSVIPHLEKKIDSVREERDKLVEVINELESEVKDNG